MVILCCWNVGGWRCDIYKKMRTVDSAGVSKLNFIGTRNYFDQSKPEGGGKSQRLKLQKFGWFWGFVRVLKLIFGFLFLG